MKKTTCLLTAFFLLVCLLTLSAFPVPARAYDEMTTGDAAIELIRRYEGFSSKMYYEGGHWYVGYGSQVKEGAYPNGVSEDEAIELVRKELARVETALNAFFERSGLTPTQAQFDALVDFTYTLGTAWLSGSSDLLQIVSGTKETSRLETVHAFGVWCHAGGIALPGLANRRIEEAALYLDGTADAAGNYAYLIVKREEDVIRTTDFAVYEVGGVYDAFPVMFRLGYTFQHLVASDGSEIHVGDMVEGSRSTTAVWEKNVYSESFSDVSSEKWFYDYVMELSEGGVIGGRGGGIFDPNSPVTVGEALKLILLAAGYDEQAAEEGAHWASGYAALAYEGGFLPDELLSDPEQPIRRAEVAQLAAKAIGFGQSFSDSPFADTDDGYVTALAEIGVLTGMTEHDETVFHPDGTLTRAEVSTIVWRLRSVLALGKTQTVSYASRDLPVVAGVPFSSYQRTGFSGSGRDMAYVEPGVTVLRGIDVSRFQGEIDWEAVKAQGIDFAILRVGGRYQESGGIYDDRLFEAYYAGASAVGLRLGVYFYSQAITVDEALEEADYVLDRIAGKRIDGPVVFDWETAGASGARTNNIPAALITDCAIAYCERVRTAGYAPMVYLMRYDGYMRYDLTRLLDYDWWYAGEYDGAYPKFFYDFQMWQYTSSGLLDGVEGETDMDLWFFR